MKDSAKIAARAVIELNSVSSPLPYLNFQPLFSARGPISPDHLVSRGVVIVATLRLDLGLDLMIHSFPAANRL